MFIQTVQKSGINRIFITLILLRNPLKTDILLSNSSTFQIPETEQFFAKIVQSPQNMNGISVNLNILGCSNQKQVIKQIRNCQQNERAIILIVNEQFDDESINFSRIWQNESNIIQFFLVRCFKNNFFSKINIFQNHQKNAAYFPDTENQMQVISKMQTQNIFLIIIEQIIHNYKIANQTVIKSAEQFQQIESDLNQQDQIEQIQVILEQPTNRMVETQSKLQKQLNDNFDDIQWEDNDVQEINNMNSRSSLSQQIQNNTVNQEYQNFITNQQNIQLSSSSKNQINYQKQYLINTPQLKQTITKQQKQNFPLNYQKQIIPLPYYQSQNTPLLVSESLLPRSSDIMPTSQQLIHSDVQIQHKQNKFQSNISTEIKTQINPQSIIDQSKQNQKSKLQIFDQIQNNDVALKRRIINKKFNLEIEASELASVRSISQFEKKSDQKLYESYCQCLII